MRQQMWILIFLCAVTVTITGVAADNSGDVSDYHIQSGEFLLIEIDFTVGASAWIDLDISSNQSIDVILMPQESLGPLMSGGSRLGIFDYSYFDVYIVEDEFVMSENIFDNKIYYFFIEPPPYERIRISVRYTALVDYDGDGIYGDQDDEPLINQNRSIEIINRLNALEGNDSTTIFELMTIKAGIYQIETNLSLFQSTIVKDLSDLEITVQTNLEYLISIIDNVLNSQLDLEETLILDMGTINDTLLDIIYELSSLSDWINETNVNNNENLTIIYADISNLEMRMNNIENDFVEINEQLDNQYNELRSDLDSLDRREAAETLALNKAAEKNLEEALSDANSARNIGIVVGIIGIILAIAALFLIRVNLPKETTE